MSSTSRTSGGERAKLMKIRGICRGEKRRVQGGEGERGRDSETITLRCRV